MRNLYFRFMIIPIAFALCLAFGCQQQGEKAEPNKTTKDNLQLDRIPSVVMNRLKAKFPGAEIHKWTKEVEDSITVYDIEFEQAGRKFEADIKEDGTIHNWEKAIERESLPEAVNLSIQAAYPNASLRQIMEISAVVNGKDTLEGYEIQLETAEMTEVELTVAPGGEVLEDSGQNEP